MMDRNSIFKTSSLVFLAALMVMCAAWAVSATGWTSGLSILPFVGLGAIVIGLMLARSLIPGVIAHLFSVVIGIAWSFWLTARLLPTSHTWLERWAELARRLSRWYYEAWQGGVSHDNLMFILQMGVIVWGMAYLAIWFLFRSRQVWPAVVPGGVVLIINLYYAPKDISFWFLTYLLVALLLVIRFNLFNQQRRWRREEVFFHPDVSFDFIRDGLIFSALVIGLAWFAPPVVAESPGLLDEFQGTWHDFQASWNRLYANLNYRPADRIGDFAQTLPLGGPRNLVAEPVMDVRLEGGRGRYWRAAVYDTYTGQEWRNTDQDSAAFDPQTNLALPVFEARQPVTQTYTFYKDGALVLYAMSDPISLDRSAKITFNAILPQLGQSSQSPVWPSTTGPWVEEITYIRSNASVDSSESYQAVSEASQATVKQLKLAGTRYPVWVTARYLQLPPTITERTRRLARELTLPLNTPYDKTQAIETYLRAHITYNEKIAMPPADVDKVDYVLFETKEGYCDYYASAMVVLLRSVGIPARLAAGFAQGKYNDTLDIYRVLNTDAHSWVEVYFPRYGWIEFEPTAAQPVIVRPTAIENVTTPMDSTHLEQDRGPIPGKPDNIPIDENLGGIGPFVPLDFNLSLFGLTLSVPRYLVNGTLTVLGLATVIGLVVAGYWWRQQQLAASHNIFNIYQTMVRLAGWLGAALRPWQTPYEHATILSHHLPQSQRDIDLITNEYVRQIFGPAKPKTMAEALTRTKLTYESVLAWRRLRVEMIKTALKHRLPWQQR